MAKGLGKGLGALIPSAAKHAVTSRSSSDDKSEEKGVMEIPLDQIKVNPAQPRKYFDHSAMEDLADSIKEYGILQPLVITPRGEDGKHMLIAGERRLRAAEMLGLKAVPAIVRKVDEHEKLALAIVENIQRADLNPVEEALAYQKLMDEFNLTQAEVAKRVGKSRSGIANVLRVLELPEEVREAVAGGKISLGHAKVLAGLDNAKQQEEYLERVLNQKMTVRELEQATEKSRKIAKPQSQKFDPVREAQEEMLRERLGTKVQIKKTGAKGQIMIHFYSLEELQRLLNELT